ncbi:DeoR/GlpR family DNA-binding transcription regulator [Mesorhizobium atlanticum]|nr:DeoR/GlpR family DNA-binding transcription regulator [Mesorhizobium atlanticum]
MVDQERDAPQPRGSARLGAARQQQILTLISNGDIIAVGDLAERFGVSQESIRRDIRALDQAGLLRRVHGGVAPMAPVDLTARRPVAERLELDRSAKMAAAEAALPLFQEGMNIFLGGSSTMLLLADALAGQGPALSVTTNMIDIATRLAVEVRFKVTLLGGVLKPTTRTLIGPDILNALDHQVFDLAVCGASSVDAVHGFLGPSEWHAAIGAKLTERARCLVVVADATKFNRSDAYVVLPLSRVAVLATDRAAPPDMAIALEEAGVRVLLPTGHNSSTRSQSGQAL